MAFSEDERKQIRHDFFDFTNMSPAELERWLQTGESKSVGDTGGEGESTGHASGRRIMELKHKTRDKLSEDDYRHMRKVVNYIKRHTAQKPSHDIDGSRWRYSLMNWGYDPLKEERK
ncbi:MAG: DUF3140 domain-containing protein [Chitinivibrionales bacterium]|nr:DUF3140 domain-containing protein [Chitinivibrionales bacterium]MBD3356011.1 DUF3140 domain-containing protein [Chitinivibrionales bacterium]